MKLTYILIFFSLFSVVRSQNLSTRVRYSDNAPMTLNLRQNKLRVVQFTDLHLSYGFDKNDRKTFDLIKTITKTADPDLVVFTGDQTMSIRAPHLYKKLIKVMENLKTPWTFIFGNHDNDFHSYQRLLNVVEKANTTYLQFKVGPKLDNGGFGNFKINLTFEDLPIYSFYFFDSKAELKKRTNEHLSKYEYLSQAQVEWYKNSVSEDTTKSSVFVHIPLEEYNEASDDNISQGKRGEEVYMQGKNTGLFSAMVESGKTEAIFVGHDHRNNYLFQKEGITLAYGAASGYNGYGYGKKGARIIDIENNLLSSYLVFEDLAYVY